jgi:hypothetical protein
MPFHSWLQILRSALAPGRSHHRYRRKGSQRAASHRPCLEALEDRTVLSFAAPVGYAAGTNPYAVVTADFDGNGKLDLAVANAGGNSVSILLGNGDGTFQTATDYDAGYSPQSLAVGDFDGDGKLDLLTVSPGGGVSVLLGNGDGSLQPPQSIWTGGNSPLAAAVGDFNADGKMDLAVTGYYPGRPGYWGYWGYYPGTPPASEVSVLLGNGDGTFAASSYHDLLGDYSPSIATGDFNGDSNPDLVWADGSASAVGVLLGNGDGTFADSAQFFATNNYTGSVAVADFNGDGSLDLVTGRYTQSATVLLGNGDGTFGAATDYATASSFSLEVADFNGDGNPDLVTANYADDSVGVLLGNGDGSFRGNQLSAAGSFPAGVAAGDFDGDGRLDLAVADNNAGVSVLLNTGDWRSFRIGGFPSATTAGDPHTVTVTALDSNGDVMTGYTGTVHFASGDPQAGLPDDYKFTTADHGVQAFTVTLRTAGTQSITVTDTSLTSFSGMQGPITVNPAAASTFHVGGFPSPVSVGDSGGFSVAAYDAFGNLVTDYAGTVHFTSSDGQPGLPADYTFTPGYNYGTGYFTATLRTAGPQSITATDKANAAVTGSQTGIHVNPLASITGPNGGLRNQSLTFTLGATSGLPASTAFTFAIDWNGDGATDQTVTGPSGTTVTHSYTSSGGYNVGVAATIHIGAEDYTSPTASQSVTIFDVTATIQADPGDATKSALVVQGTAGADSLVLSPGAGNAIALSVSGTSVGSFSAPGGAAFAHLLVYGNGGADTIRLTGNLSVPALLFGGDGNDTLDASGSTANNALVGGTGNETLQGGSGRDLMIGGTGTDTLRAGSGGAILIGGTTDYDGNLSALLAIMKEWGRTDANYSTRVKHLSGTLSGGLNGSYRLTKTTIHDDNAMDNLYGGAGLDWFFVDGNGKKKDKVSGQTSGEVVTSI